MVRSERESKNKIARFGGLKPPIPAISNVSASEKQTPAQSLRGLFTDDKAGHDDFPRELSSHSATASLHGWNTSVAPLLVSPSRSTTLGQANFIGQVCTRASS